MSAVSAGHRAPIATTSAQVRCVRPATGIADPATLLPLRVAMPSSVGPCRRSRDPLPARRTAQPVPVRRPGDLTPSACHSPSVSPRRGSHPTMVPPISREHQGHRRVRGCAASNTVSRWHCENAEDATQSVVESTRAAEPAGGRASLRPGRDASQAIRRWLRSRRGLRCTVGDVPSTSRSRNMFQEQRVARSASRVCGTL